MKISFGLSSKEVDRAVRELKEYKSNLEKKKEIFFDRLAEEGIQLVHDSLSQYQFEFSAGELESGIGSERTEDGVCIFCDSDHCAFVEFGTGTKGMESPYPYDIPDDVSWDYNSGSHIFETKDGRLGWIYPADDGNYYFTEGMDSRPYMAPAAEQLRRRIVEIAKEVYGSDR